MNRVVLLIVTLICLPLPVVGQDFQQNELSDNVYSITPTPHDPSTSELQISDAPPSSPLYQGVGKVPHWGSFPQGGVMAAAWCITKDNNKAIKDKSMRDGNCLGVLKQVPWVANVSEHKLGEVAIKLACGIEVVSDLGIDLAVDPIDLLAICQCHNLTSQAWLRRDAAEVRRALTEWGCS